MTLYTNKTQLYPSVTLYRFEDGSFAYTDTTGERFEFASPEYLWATLTEEGEEFSDDIRQFIFDN